MSSVKEILKTQLGNNWEMTDSKSSLSSRNLDRIIEDIDSKDFTPF